MIVTLNIRVSEVLPRVEYLLSESGESMRPVMKSMENCGTSYKGQMNSEDTDT